MFVFSCIWETKYCCSGMCYIIVPETVNSPLVSARKTRKEKKPSLWKRTLITPVASCALSSTKRPNVSFLFFRPPLDGKKEIKNSSTCLQQHRMYLYEYVFQHQGSKSRKLGEPKNYLEKHEKACEAFLSFCCCSLNWPTDDLYFMRFYCL